MEEDIKRGLIMVLVVLTVFTIVFLVTSFREKSITGYMGRYGYLNFTITAANVTNQTVIFSEGWNLISFNAEPADKSITNVLAPIDGYYTYILEWNSSSQEFNIWSKTGAKEFTEFNMNKSYFIFLEQAANVDVTGARFGDFDIILLPGWESPNYPYEYNISISGSTFYNINFSYIMRWDIPSQEFKIYSVYSSSPEFTEIPAGEGYFIQTEGGTIEYVRV